MLIMKNIKYLLLLPALAALALTSCKQDSAQIDALPCATDSTHESVVESNGEIVSLDIADARLSAVVNGFFTASTPDGVTVYRLHDGVAEPVEGLGGLVSAGYMSEGVMPVVRQGGHIELVDKKGETVAVLQTADGEITESGAFFQKGVLVVTSDKGLQGLVNIKGEFVLQPQYASIGPVDDKGLMVAMREVGDENDLQQRFELINTDGSVLNTFDASVQLVSDVICDGKVVARTADGFAVVDATNSQVVAKLPANVARVDEVSAGAIVYRASGRVKGLIDFNGNQLLPAKYRQLRIGPSETVAAFDGKNWQIVKYSGELVVTTDGVSMLSPAPRLSFPSGFAYVETTANGCNLRRADGQLVLSTPVMKIGYESLATEKVTTDYAVSTTLIELPDEEDLNGE